MQKPGWVPPHNPDVAFDFTRGTGWKGTGTGGGAVVPVSSLLTVTRASTAMIDDLKGQWRTFPAGTLARSDKGASIWEARTNLALWCRDLTNAAWAKVTMTTALTATGIDGAANSATTITATGAASTILQTVTQASTADTVSFFVRRRTGTGTIEVTPDGVAFTDITAALATAATATPGGWYRAVVSATLVNPVLGLRVATSGDAVDVDFAGLEAATFVGPPIETTTVPVTRAATATIINSDPPFPVTAYTLFGEATPSAPDSGAGNNPQSLFQYDDGSGNDRVQLSRRNVAGDPAAMNITTGAAATVTNSVASWLSAASGKQIMASAAGDQAMSFNGAAVVTSASAMPITPSILRLGTNSAAGVQWDGLIRVIAIWKTKRLENSVLRDRTAP